MKCHQNISESRTHKQIVELWGRCSSSGPWSKEVILTGVLWESINNGFYIMYRRDTNLGMHHVTNSIYSCLWLLMNDGSMVENMMLYMWQISLYLLPISTSQYPCIRIHTEVQGEAEAESQAQQSQDQHHSTPGWALPRAVRSWSIILEHLMVYTQITHPAGWGWFLILGIDFDLKIWKWCS